MRARFSVVPPHPLSLSELNSALLGQLALANVPHNLSCRFDTTEVAMRLAGRERLGFYPLPKPEAERVRRFLRFPDQQCSMLDPCIGDGVAFAEISSDKLVSRYGIE